MTRALRLMPAGLVAAIMLTTAAGPASAFFNYNPNIDELPNGFTSGAPSRGRSASPGS